VTYFSGYDRFAPTPAVGSRWVWEAKLPHAREEITIDEVLWNGEEWWILTRAAKGVYWNSLDRFWEAVGGPGLRCTIAYRLRRAANRMGEALG
jgi:hypothetical protein